MISSSLKFRYNGIDSDTMKLINISLSPGFTEEPFVAPRELKEIKIKGRDKPYFQEIELSPLSFSLNFAFTETWDDDLINSIKAWLCQPYYKPMVFSDDIEIVDEVEVINKIYYCIMVSDSKILHSGLNEGYCTLQFRCDSPYAYSPKITAVKDYSVNASAGTLFTINNLGSEKCFPKITIEKVGDGVSEPDISIVNTSDSNRETKLITAKKASGILTITGGIKDGETVAIGDDVYEFDIDNSIESGNIKVDISEKTTIQASTELTLTEPVKDGELIKLGNTIYEFDTNSTVGNSNSAIDISSYAVASTGTLSFTGKPIDGEVITIGNDTFEFDTNNSIASGNIRVDISGTNGTDVDAIINQLVSIINTNTTENISATANTVDDTVTITCDTKGSIGNAITTYKTSTALSWANSSLIDGTDCSIENAITAIITVINLGTNFVASVPSPNPNNKINIVAKSTGVYAGSKGNFAVCTTTCTGSFNSATLIGGLDCTALEGITALTSVINASATEAISATSDANGITVIYDVSGTIGEIPVSTDMANAIWSGIKLIGGDGILDDEIIVIDNERGTITSSLFDTYRYNAFNGNYLYLKRGENKLLIKGNAIFTFEYEFKYL